VGAGSVLTNIFQTIENKEGTVEELTEIYAIEMIYIQIMVYKNA